MHYNTLPNVQHPPEADIGRFQSHKIFSETATPHLAMDNFMSSYAKKQATLFNNYICCSVVILIKLSENISIFHTVQINKMAYFCSLFMECP